MATRIFSAADRFGHKLLLFVRSERNLFFSATNTERYRPAFNSQPIYKFKFQNNFTIQYNTIYWICYFSYAMYWYAALFWHQDITW